MSVLDKTFVDLGPSRTYADRDAEWVPGERPGEGLLIITLRKSLRAGAVSERDLYQVQEEAAPEAGVRSWLLLNVSDERQPDVYRVQVGPRGNTCTCRAGKVNHFRCKHEDALVALQAEGAIPQAPADEVGYAPILSEIEGY